MFKYKKRTGPPGPHVWSIKHNLSKWKCPLPYPTQNDQVHQKVCHKAWVWQSPKQIQPDKNSTKMSTFVQKTEIPDKKKVYPPQPLSSAHGAICCPPLDRLVARLYVGISLDLKPLKSCWPSWLEGGQYQLSSENPAIRFLLCQLENWHSNDDVSPPNGMLRSPFQS